MNLRVVIGASLIAGMLSLSACGGDDSSGHGDSASSPASSPNASSGASDTTDATYTIGGKVTGLSGGTVTLANATESLSVNANGAFSFAQPVPYNGSYAVTVSHQPVGQTCSVQNYTGSGVTANVTNLSVNCSTNTYAVSGAVAGLVSGQSLSLQNNGNAADTVRVSANGAFTFGTLVPYNGSYNVTVAAQPVGQTCTVQRGAGAGVTAKVSDVSVICSAITHTIGGTVSGLASGSQVTLQDNGADFLALTQNGAFTFATPVAFNGSYRVTVGTQPVGQVCTVNNGSGTGVVDDVTSVAVACSATTYTVGGAVTGLGSAQQVTLLNNGADALTLTENGTFNFPTPVAYGGNYAVSVGTQPGGETCTVTNGMGTNLSGDVTSVSVACQGPQYTVTTVAGTGAQGSENGQAAAATFSLPSGLRVGTDGTVYVADTANNLIRSISPSGTVATVAGSGINGTASFSEPLDIAVGSNGNLFVADAGNHTIRIINSASGAETGEGASFGRPYGIASDASGNLYVADETNMNIRKISSRGVITTIAGSLASGSADGTGAAAQFNHPTGIAVDTDGTLYVADAGNCEIRKIAAGNVVTTLAGSTSCGFADGTGSAAKFGSPFKIALDTNGDLYVTDGANNSIRKVTRDGVVTTVAGSRVAGATDGLGASASFNNPTGIAIDSFGNIYVADTTNNKIRRLSLHP